MLLLLLLLRAAAKPAEGMILGALLPLAVLEPAEGFAIRSLVAFAPAWSIIEPAQGFSLGSAVSVAAVEPAQGHGIVTAAHALYTLLWVTEPVQGLDWWRIREYQAHYYYVFQSGWQERLQSWEEQCLEVLFEEAPEMGMYISWMSSSNGWHDVPEFPPWWDWESRQWHVSRHRPDRRSYDYAEDVSLASSTGGQGWWASPEAPGEALHGSTQEKAAAAWQTSWAQEAPKPAQGSGAAPSSDRFATRGYHSQARRAERRALLRAGMPVPPHLQPEHIDGCIDLKRQMWELQQKLRENARAQGQQACATPGQGAAPAEGGGRKKETLKLQPLEPPRPRRDRTSVSRTAESPKPNECRNTHAGSPKAEAAEPEEGSKQEAADAQTAQSEAPKPEVCPEEELVEVVVDYEASPADVVGPEQGEAIPAEEKGEVDAKPEEGLQRD